MPWVFEQALVVNVTDGDTLKVELDLGLDLTRRNIRVRLLHAWAPELTEPGGPEAKAYVQSIVSPGQSVKVVSAKWDRYANRIDGEVILADGRELGELVIAAGHAVRK